MGVRRLIAAVVLIAAVLAPIQVEAKKIVVIRGIGGNVVAPMTSIIVGLRARGHRVTVREWFQGVPSGFDVAIGHSAGDRPALMSGARQVLTLDPTWANPGCQRESSCLNWYAPIDAFPLIVCCGGYRVSGAVNVVVPGGHTAMPERIARRVVAAVK